MPSLKDRRAEAAPWAFKTGAKSWGLRYVLACVLPVLAFIFIFRKALGLGDLFAEGQIGIATVLGLTGIIGVSVGLMMAVFYSSRSGQDDTVHDATQKDEPKDSPGDF